MGGGEKLCQPAAGISQAHTHSPLSYSSTPIHSNCTSSTLCFCPSPFCISPPPSPNTQRSGAPSLHRTSTPSRLRTRCLSWRRLRSCSSCADHGCGSKLLSSTDTLSASTATSTPASRSRSFAACVCMCVVCVRVCCVCMCVSVWCVCVWCVCVCVDVCVVLWFGCTPSAYPALPRPLALRCASRLACWRGRAP